MWYVMRFHVKWIPCLCGLAQSEVAHGGEASGMEGSCEKVNELLWIAVMGWSSIMGVWQGR